MYNTPNNQKKVGFFENPKNVSMLIKICTGAILALVIFINSCTIVNQRERGIKYTLGQVKGETIQPGVVFHAPFVTKIKKYTIVPQEYEVDFKVGTDDCAVTKDLQDLGMKVNVKYVYDEDRIKEIAMKYGDSAITSAMKTKIQASVKATSAQYTIYEVVEKQATISQDIGKQIMSTMTAYPIKIISVDVVNLNWTQEFDNQIKDTANRTQQVKIAEQEANIAAANAQKRVKEAEADKQAAQLAAEALVLKAEGEAKAKKIEADAIAYTNKMIAQNQTVETAKWRHEEQMEYYKKWDGKLVPDYIPLTAAGGVVNLR